MNNVLYLTNALRNVTGTGILGYERVTIKEIAAIALNHQVTNMLYLVLKNSGNTDDNKS